MNTLDPRVDTQYLDVQIPGPDATSGVHFVDATVEVARTQAILDNPSDWYMAIIKATIPLTSTPLYIMPIFTQAQGNTGPYDPTLTPYIIGLIVTPSSGPQVWFGANVRWSPEVIVAGGGPGTDWSNQNQYYYMYSINHFLILINNALDTVWASFLSAYPAYAGNAPPQFTINSAGVVGVQASVILAQNYTPGSGIPRVQMAQNLALGSLLAGFPLFSPQQANPSPLWDATSILNAQQIYEPTVGILDAVSVAGFFYWTFYEQTATPAAWAAPRTLLIVSNDLPAWPEALPGPTTGPSPLQYAQPGVNVTQPGGGAAQYPIIASYDCQYNNLSDIRSVAFYIPTVYRLVNLLSNAPLYKFQITIQWSDPENSIHTLSLSQNQSAQLKFVFLRKGSPALTAFMQEGPAKGATPLPGRAGAMLRGRY